MIMPMTKPIPLLKEGDRLTREEFEIRYGAMPESVRAELVEGVVYMSSPVHVDQHGGPHAHTIGWAFVYKVFTPGVAVADNSSVRLDMINEPQPDGILYIENGGQVRVVDGYVTFAPEWAGEISASSVALDLGPKFEAYRRNGVREYFVWRVLDREIDWFVLRGAQFERLSPDAAEIFRSEIFPGLWLDAAAMVNGDMLRVHDVLQQGLHSPDHQEFVEKLKQRAAKN